jgi:Ca2+-binding RTX toxin-like protein
VKKLSSLCRTLSPLLIAASCAGGDQPTGESNGDPADFEGIEEATQGLSDLGTQCTFVAGTGIATLAMVGSEVAMISKLSSGALGVNGFACSTATTVALKKLIITGDAMPQNVIIDYLGGTFAPGTATGVGIDVDLGGGTDALKFRGTKLADVFVFGSTGIATNIDTFKDISYANVETFVVTMSDGADNFSGAGNAVTGGAFATAVTVYGGAGDDIIRGGAGNDILDGGDGNDTFTTGTGPDGNDTIRGGAGTADVADYSTRTLAVSLSLDATANDGDIATSELDNIASDVEVLKGGLGNDILIGGAGNETLFGGPGDDTLTGGLGNDTLNGDAGDDTFDEGAVTSGTDIINGGAGTDTVTYASRTIAVTINLDATATSGEGVEHDKIALDVENAIGGAGDDTINGSPVDNVLDGGPGADTINGLAGNDTLRGGLGNDVLNGGVGDDRFDEGSVTNGADTMNGGTGVDTVDYSHRTVGLVVVMNGTTPSGEADATTHLVTENDLIKTDVENIIGGGGDDSLTGNAADNQIEGGAGDDTMFGLDGDDVLDGGGDGDVLDCGLGDADAVLNLTFTSSVNCEL